MMRTIDQLFEDSTLTVEDVAEQANLTAERVEAIAMGRWTPNPKERQGIAAVFDVPIDKISWGHTMDPRNIRYRQIGFRKDS